MPQLIGLLGAAIFVPLALFIGSFSWNTPTPEPELGASYIRSLQLAASPVNGTCLGTDGTDNSWVTCGSGSAGDFSSSTPWTVGFLPYITGNSSFKGVATSSLAVGTGLTSSGTLGAQVGGTASSISFASIAANSLWANATGGAAVPTAISTTTLFGANITAGHVLMSNGTSWVAAATSTCIQITGSSALCDGDDATGGGSSGGTWSTTTSTVSGQLINYPNNDDDIVAIGSNSTTTAEWYFDPNLLVMSVGTGAAGDSTMAFGPNTSNQWIMGYDETDKSFAIASSTALGTTNALTIDKNLRTTLVFASSTAFSTSYASSTLWYGGGLATCASGSFVTWTGGLFGCDTDDNTTYTAGDALTLTGTDIDFDGGATPAGDLGGTWASPSVTDDSHAHTGTTLSAIAAADFSDSDWGDITIATNVASVEDDSHAHTASTISGLGTADISGLDVSDDLNLTGGVGLTLTGDDMACDTATGSVFGCLSAADWTTFNNKWDLASSTIPITKGGTGLTALGASSTVLTTNGTIMIWQSIVTYVESVISAASLVLTGNWDFGGATGLEIPNGTAPTVNATGELAIDTTTDQLVGYGATAKKVYGNGNDYTTFTYATSTAWVGTTTIPLGPSFVAETWNGMMCFTDTGTVNVSINDGTNRATISNASTTVGTVILSTNNTFTAAEKRYVDIGTPASTPTKVSCTVSRSLTSD